jgi:hypothetical protein
LGLLDKSYGGAIKNEVVFHDVTEGFVGRRKLKRLDFYANSHSLFVNQKIDIRVGSSSVVTGSLSKIRKVLSVVAHDLGLTPYHPPLQEADYNQQHTKNPDSPIGQVFPYGHGRKFSNFYGVLCILTAWGVCGPLVCGGVSLLNRGLRMRGWSLIFNGLGQVGTLTGAIGCSPWNWRQCIYERNYPYQPFHNEKIVTQQYLTSFNLCNTVIVMANAHSTRKIAAINALAERSSIYSIIQEWRNNA